MSEMKLLRENGIYISYKKPSEELGLDPKTLYNWKNHAKKTQNPLSYTQRIAL